MTSFIRFTGLIGLGLAAMAVAAGPAAAEVTLKFGVYATDSRADIERQFRPALAVLEEALSRRLNEEVKITLEISPTYEGGLDDLVQGRVDFTRLGPASYVLGTDLEPNISILAMESVNGERAFYGIICVAEDSDITEVSQLKGRSFAFGDDQSTIGRYLSQLYLVENGIRVGDLARFDYLGRHDKVGIAVGRGEFDAGALKESTFRKLVKKGVPIRELARFPNVTKPWVARAGLPAELEQALRVALLNLKDKKALKALQADGMLAGSDADYETIRQSIKENDRFFETKTTMK